MAGQVLGGAVLSGFLNVMFDRIASKEVVDLFRGEKVVNKLLIELKNALRSANALLDEAEEKQLGDPSVKGWLEELKEVIYEADDVMDKISTEVLRRKLEKSGRSTNMFFHVIPAIGSAFDNVTVRSEIEEILYILKLLLEQKDFLGLEKVDRNKPLKRLVAPLVEESDVFGRDSDKKEIIKLLLSDDGTGPKISVIPIVGMGGIGKTTLAQLVYRDSSITKHFNLKVWVTVSNEFDVFEITKVIFEQISGRDCNIKDPYHLQNKLIKSLKGKRFLFVFDDVWNENYNLWDALKSSLVSGARGSRIIVTTRSEIVASKMGGFGNYNLKIISDDDCWDLFVKHVFDDVNSGEHLNLQEIGKQIVRKCKGLPLAVKSIAGILQSVSDPKEWRLILESNIRDLELQENGDSNILRALWLSYYLLPPNVKQCFAYLSIFPKDYEFHKNDREKISLLWMAEGLLGTQNKKRVEEVGEEYFNILVSRSFFQRSQQNESVLVMHDLMHDLALLVSGGLHKISSKSRHLSYKKDSKDEIRLAHLFGTNCLRTLLALPLSLGYKQNPTSLQTVLDDEVLLKGGRCLRALSLSESSITELPDLIGSLKSLRYLDLSSTEIGAIPTSVCTLYNLQTLLLTRCKKLTQLPADMSCLISLRHLDIRETSLKEMPPQMYNMKNLQTLTDFVIGESDGFRITELGELQLHGSLCISGLDFVMDIKDVKTANLKEKQCLDELILRWIYGKMDDITREMRVSDHKDVKLIRQWPPVDCQQKDHRTTKQKQVPDALKPDDAIKEKEVLDALKPHTSLKKLEIYGLRGTDFPDWVAHQSFNDIVKVGLFSCTNCILLPPFGQLPSLRELEIHEMVRLRSIGDEFCGTFSTSKPFPSLEKLTINGMDSWENWSFTRANQEGRLFPCLKKLDIRFCDNLNVGLPAGCLPSLESIIIEFCDSMVAIFPTSQLQFDTAYPLIEYAKIRDCPRLESFLGSGLPSTLKELEIVGCQRLTSNRLSWNLHRLSCLQSLSIGGTLSKELVVEDSFPEDELLPTTLTDLRLESFRNLKGLNGRGLHHLTSLRNLSIIFCRQLECLPADGLPLSLSSLDIYDCPLLSVRCQRGTGEDWPKIQHIPRIVVDIKEI